MLRTESNRDLIAEIEGGIKKEVSVGCAVHRCLCSICGKEMYGPSGCGHQKGESYQGKLCYGELEDPTDAYEWSFVAVPAQKAAGITKSAAKLEAKKAVDLLLNGGLQYCAAELEALEKAVRDVKEGDAARLARENILEENKHILARFARA